MSEEKTMDRATTEKTNGSQFAGIALPPDADFLKLRQFAHDLAQQEFDAADGDRKEAHSTLMKMTGARPDMAEKLQTVVFDEFWRQYIRLCSRSQKKRIEHNIVRGNGEEAKPWSVPDTLGEGLVAKRQNMDTIYDYQFPFLGKSIGLSTKIEFTHALGKVETRRETDSKLIDVGKAIQKRIAKADKDAIIQDIVPAEELARLFRHSGVVS